MQYSGHNLFPTKQEGPGAVGPPGLLATPAARYRRIRHNDGSRSAASTCLSRSPTTNGSNPAVIAPCQPTKRDSQASPNANKIAEPSAIAAHVVKKRRSHPRSARKPVTYAAGTNPTRYPPLGE